MLDVGCSDPEGQVVLEHLDAEKLSACGSGLLVRLLGPKNADRRASGAKAIIITVLHCVLRMAFGGQISCLKAPIISTLSYFVHHYLCEILT
jgi:hypothetical protein